ncbi:MAG: tetratricopeptide repeat protein [Gemmatimonadetes bacterium]|jgi:hypothetical protein|nr:tetratricopeptide repeat protein [Gemmatimonadota bacterium]MBT6146428.1 tetratricopeptide repeat protein [Gemmatimonadota bacterium]MBT7858657.1 tetratricopeptide repeat protein [Gemmatimonadota bacterium]
MAVIRRFGTTGAVQVGAVLVLGFLAGLGSLTNELSYDDRALLLRPSLVNADLLHLVSTSYWEEVTGHPDGLYRPLTLLWLCLLYHAGSGSTLLMHLGTLLAHLAAAVCLRWAARRQGISALTATLAAMLFAVHPATTEVVNTLVGSGDAWALTLGLGALALATGRDPRLQSVAVVALLLAPLAKESALLGTLAFGLWRWCQCRDVRDPLMLAAVFATLVPVMLRWGVTGQLGAGTIGFVDNPLAHATTGVRLSMGATIPIRYANLIAFPWPLSADYSYDQLPLPAWGIGWGLGRAVVGLGLVTSIGFLAYRCGRMGKDVFWGALAGGQILLVSQVVMPIGTLFAERLAYPLAAVSCLGVGACLASLRQPLRVPVITGWLAIGVVLSLARSAQWQDDLSLFTSTAAISDRSAKAHRGLAQALQERGQLAEAVASYDRALAIYPRFSDAQYNRAIALTGLKRWTEARAGYLRVLASRPDHVDALWAVAVLTEQLNGFESAIEPYRRLLQRDPGHLGAIRALVVGWVRSGDRARARDLIEETARTWDVPALRDLLVQLSAGS